MFDFEGFSSLIAVRVARVLKEEYGFVQAPLTVTPEQAAELLGAEFSARSVKDLCFAGLLVWSRKDPSNANSHIIISRASVLHYAETFQAPTELPTPGVNAEGLRPRG